MALVAPQVAPAEWMTCREMVAADATRTPGWASFSGRRLVRRTPFGLCKGKPLGMRITTESATGSGNRIMLTALCQEPEVLVLDEPTSFLDIQFKMDLLGDSANCEAEEDRGDSLHA